MERPLVEIENYDAVYDFYYDLEPSARLARVGHAVLSQLYKPRTHFNEGADERISDLLANDHLIMFALNHVYAADTVSLPAMMRQEPVFHDMIGQTNIYAKASLFSGNQMFRKLIDGLGAKPVFRKKDVPEVYAEDEALRMRRLSTERLIAVGAHGLDKGFHAAIFPEGERDENFVKAQRNPRIVKPLRPGIVDMIHASNDPERIAIIPMGFSYGEKAATRSKTKTGKVTQEIKRRKPVLVVGSPIRVSTRVSKTALRVETQDALQRAVDIAWDIQDNM